MRKYDFRRMHKRLEKYELYDEKIEEYQISYDFEAPEFKQIKEANHLDEFDDIRKLKAMSTIMHQVNLKFHPSEKSAKAITITEFSALSIDDILKDGKALSCWVQATYLTEVFLALGIPARMVRCMSGIRGDYECHCVTVAFCEEYKKLVLFDVANDSIYYSEKAVPLDLCEFRDYIVKGKRIYYVQKKNHEKEGLMKYWIKNLMVFQSYEIQRYGNELGKKENRFILLIPQDFDERWILRKCKWDYPCVISRNQKQFWSV